MNKTQILNMVRKIIEHIRVNKYSITLACFLIWVLIFDKYNYATQRELGRTVAKLEEEKVIIREEIEETKQLLSILDRDKEKYARERYYMHAENEDVFIINTEIKE